MNTPTPEQVAKAKELMSHLTDNVGLVDSFIIESRRLVKVNVKHIICDLDDTLCSRRAQMRNEPLLQTNRGEDGNTLVFNDIGAHDFILEHYEGINIPQDILQLLSKEDSLILTAGIRILQELKIRSLGLDDLNSKVVPDGLDKILETIYHILFDLKFIPEIIEVFEDKPHHFVRYRELIEICLGTKLKIFMVEMDGNQGYKNIEEIIPGSDLEQTQIQKSILK